MAPKRKATTSASSSKKAKATPKWFWAGDSAKGSQDTWIEYDDDVAEKIEEAYSNGKKTYRIDKERFVDLENHDSMWQRRYDDKTKMRKVKREDGTGDKAEADESDKEEEPVITWSWAGDSKAGSQDVWIKYDEDVAEKIEEAYQKKSKTLRLDKERFIDFEDRDNILQRRYDDKTKRRSVRREESKTGGSSGSIELVFSFDTTGSMMCVLEEVRKKVADTVSRLLRDLPGIRIGVVQHGDYCDGATKLMTYVDLCRDESKITKFIKNAPSTGGGDAPEAYEYVLEQAQNMDWTSGSAKALVMIGDAAPHTPAESLKQMKQYKIPTPHSIDWKKELGNLKAKGIKVHGVRCHSSTEKFYDEVASMTGGKCVNLDQFHIVSDMILAMCFKEGGEDMLKAFRLEVEGEGRMDDKMLRLFRELGEEP